MLPSVAMLNDFDNGEVLEETRDCLSSHASPRLVSRRSAAGVCLPINSIQSQEDKVSSYCQRGVAEIDKFVRKSVH